jgi:hypothetical protein
MVGDRAWDRSSDLVLIDPFHPLNGKDIAPWEGTVLIYSQRMLLGAFSSVPHAVASPVAMVGDGPAFVYTLHDDTNGIRVEARGIAEGDKESWRVFEVEILEGIDPRRNNGRAYRFSDPQMNDALGRTVWRRVEEWAPNGRLDRVLLFQSAGFVSDEEFKALTEDPVAGGRDPFRGVVATNRVLDYRQSPVVEEKRLPDGSVTSRTIPAPGERKEMDWLRVGGWLTAAMCLAVIVALRVWKRS